MVVTTPIPGYDPDCYGVECPGGRACRRGACECPAGEQDCRGRCTPQGQACVDVGGDVGVDVRVSPLAVYGLVAAVALGGVAFAYYARVKFGGGGKR